MPEESPVGRQWIGKKSLINQIFGRLPLAVGPFAIVPLDLRPELFDWVQREEEILPQLHPMKQREPEPVS
jgi:hypothetical protein